MRILRHLDPPPAAARGAAIALGNFDGVHLGHQAVIGETIRIARALGAPAAILTFEPHPREILAPGGRPFRLTPFRVKARLAMALGVDHLVVLRFSPEFAARSAGDFVDKILIKALSVGHVVTGGNFRFGHGREGDVAFLRRAAAAHGFGMTAMAPVAAPDGAQCSSSAVRARLAEGDMKGAAMLLGRPWSVEGRVRRGDARGRVIGFPTANLAVGRLLLPPLGVYAVRVTARLDGGEARLEGVANLGRRPTFAGEEVRLEVHLFDFAGDLYGRRLCVDFIDGVRPERRFDGLESLKAQIEADCAEARVRLKAFSDLGDNGGDNRGDNGGDNGDDIRKAGG